jgi:hypothetical protein
MDCSANYRSQRRVGEIHNDQDKNKHAKKLPKKGQVFQLWGGGRFWQTIPNGNHDSLGHNSSNRLERFSFFFLILLSLKDVCRLMCTKERI